MRERWPVLAFALVMAAIPHVPGLPPFWIVLADNIGLSALVAMGLVLLTGVGGLTSFGQAAFCGFGAYTTAVLTTAYGLSPWLTLPASLIVSGLVAAQVGDIAFTRGVRLHELTVVRASLEAAVMELTADSVEFRAEGRPDEPGQLPEPELAAQGQSAQGQYSHEGRI